MQNDPMDFVVRFLRYYESEGIKDEFDKDTNKMVTSAGVKGLVKMAEEIAPPKLKGGKAAEAMRELSEEKREEAIKDNPKVIDLRAQFSRKIAGNGGARGMLTELIDAIEHGNIADKMEILMDAKKFVEAERGENVFEEVQTEV